MNHDLRFARVTEPDLRRRRFGGLAAILALVALIGGLTLTSSDARAPEHTVAWSAAADAPATQGAEVGASDERDDAQGVCNGAASQDSAVCTYY